mmetsp:Transcript_30927/g.83807  ORF Transcript_30927/g.83807 Transcript_30927/m.83807 type:complete len:248 (+) Transcript_30927:2313-3056(+)
MMAATCGQGYLGNLKSVRPETMRVGGITSSSLRAVLSSLMHTIFAVSRLLAKMPVMVSFSSLILVPSSMGIWIVSSLPSIWRLASLYAAPCVLLAACSSSLFLSAMITMRSHSYLWKKGSRISVAYFKSLAHSVLSMDGKELKSKAFSTSFGSDSSAALPSSENSECCKGARSSAKTCAGAMRNFMRTFFATQVMIWQPTEQPMKTKGAPSISAPSPISSIAGLTASKASSANASRSSACGSSERVP